MEDVKMKSDQVKTFIRTATSKDQERDIINMIRDSRMDDFHRQDLATMIESINDCAVWHQLDQDSYIVELQ